MTLFLCEKGTQVDALAQAMGIRKNGKDAKGRYNGKDIVITPLAGHIMRLKNFQEYDEKFKNISWIEMVNKKYIPYFPSPFKKIVKSKKDGKRVMNGKTVYTDYPSIFKNVKSYIDQADEIVLTPDPDNEGVTLAMEVIHYCEATNKVVGLVSMNKLEISALKKSLQQIDKTHYKNMWSAGELRAEYDWSFGMNLTVATTALLGRGTVLHIGGVKLPTIRLVVERDTQFEKFKKAYYYNVKTVVKKDNREFVITFNAKYDKKESAENLLQFLNSQKSLTISSYSEKEKKKEAPLPFTKTGLQSYVSKKYGINMDVSNKILQSLYDRKIMSYPRTGCQYYSTALYEETDDILKAIKSGGMFVDIINNIKPPYKKSKAFNDKEVDKHSHTALAPTSYISSMNDVEKKIYESVAKRYISQFLDPYRYLHIEGKSTISFNGDNIEGVFSDKITIDEGWQKIEKVDTIKYERDLPSLKSGDIVEIVKSEIVEVETKPKPRFTDDSLLSAMENIARFYDDPLIKKQLKDSGIGTEATRDIIIKELISKGYFEREGKKIISTQKARKLIDILPEDMTNPINRAKMEERLKKILERSITPDDFRKDYKDFVIKCFNDLKGLSCDSNNIITSKPSKKMQDYAKSLAKRNGIKLSKEDLNSREKLSEIIDKYKSDSYKLSDKVQQMLDKIVDKLDESDKISSLRKKDELTKDEFKFIMDKISKFLDSNKNSKTYSLSEKQKRVIQNPKSKAPNNIIKLSKKEQLTYQEYRKVREWMDKFFKKFNNNK